MPDTQEIFDDSNENDFDLESTLNFLTNQILDRFKFVFRVETPNMIRHLNKNENESQNVEEPQNVEESRLLFKKIHILFSILKDLLKYCIMQVDTKKYSKIVDEKFDFPQSPDALSSIIGFYSDAFTPDVVEGLFNIVTVDTYPELHCIGIINVNMIPFVADGKINTELLNADFISFAKLVKLLACDILGLNTDLEPHDIIENS